MGVGAHEAVGVDQDAELGLVAAEELQELLAGTGLVEDMGTVARADRRSDALVKEFQSNPAGQYLKQKIADSNGTYAEAFLSAAQGEKVAFFEKTTSYLHKGTPKFDVPFSSGKPWQGQPEFDESSQTHQVQVSVPVVSGGKSVGVLVVGVSLTKLEKVTK